MDLFNRVNRGPVLAVLAVAALTHTGCQKAIDVSAVNRCGYPVEDNVDGRMDTARLAALSPRFRSGTARRLPSWISPACRPRG